MNRKSNPIQIWEFANTNQSGFLGRAEFYNALKLVTVAQSKRELTPEMVKAALYGPAASKIPAPQINFAATVTPSSAPNLGPRGPLPNQNFPAASHPTPLVRPLQNMSASGLSTQVLPAVAGPRPATSSAFPGYGNMGGVPLQQPQVTSSQLPVRGTSPVAITTSASSVAPLTPTQPQHPLSASKPSDTSVNGIMASDSFFGGDLFSTTSSQPNQNSSPQGFSSAIVPVSGGNQSSIRTTTPDSLQTSLATHSVRPHLQQNQPAVNQNQHALVQAPNMPTSSGLPVRLQDSASGQPQPPWPRMTQTDVQKYTRVFMEVDRDRDGKITGEQARNLFLSWQLPRGIFSTSFPFVWIRSKNDFSVFLLP